MTEKIMVGMSGGVDSSVTALLLQQQGYQVAGLFMKNWEEDDTATYCSATIDHKDARDVCNKLGITLHAVNFATEYWDNVFEHFLKEYQAGRTPNPDVLCNREIKFKVFLEYAIHLGAERIATGHYAQSDKIDGRFRLLKACDDSKDQSYFLHLLTQAQLAKSCFPVGKLQKTQVRELAKQAALATQAKKDSTGICFVGERPFREFLQRFIPAQTGDIVTPEGKRVGEHQGVMYYTIGQRQGLNIGGTAEGNGEPWFVAAKDVEKNQLIVVQGHDHPLLFNSTLVGIQTHWIAGTPPADLPYTCTAKTRYRQVDQACVIERLEDDRCYVRFEQPQRAVTEGQSIVFYQGNECLGGAVIAERR